MSRLNIMSSLKSIVNYVHVIVSCMCDYVM